MASQLEKVKIDFKQAVGMLFPYVKNKILEQVKSVAFIIAYLIFFQVFVLNIGITDASIISIGIGIVIIGLAFFMEGIFLGLMPLGETIGVKLPQKAKLGLILILSFILGVGVTFAEPAIGVLKAAGSSVKPWDAPLLFLLLNKYSNYLVYAVGAGVGIAVLFGVLRFMYNWSLKPFLYILVTILSVYTIYAFFDPNLVFLTGLAWDCGGVTTGPVTVPLVLALGIGICRIVGSGDSGASGFGVVTLASLFPILMVLILGHSISGSVPKPMSEDEFYQIENRSQIKQLFENDQDLLKYVLENSNELNQYLYFGSPEQMNDTLLKLSKDDDYVKQVFPNGKTGFQNWLLTKGSLKQQLLIYESKDKINEQLKDFKPSNTVIDIKELVMRNMLASMQAIIPLVIFLFIILFIILRERLSHMDEVILGVFLGVIGMFLFNIGIEIGLAKIGSQVGENVPASFKTIQLVNEKKIINEFDQELVQTLITPDGQKEKFFYTKINNTVQTIPFKPENFNANTKQYQLIPTKGPLFGSEQGIGGIIVIILFSFLMGYGATLAEPALNALGIKVEDLTVGTFKKSLLMNTVAIGVGIGIAVGVAKIIFNIPLLYLLVPPYLILMLVTALSTEEFVNIGWDSAGVTTGPITVPLVLAMGLGIGGQLGVIEGFGILAMASVYPIFAVLTVGLLVNAKRKKALQQSLNSGE
jgi:hypothetical protein